MAKLNSQPSVGMNFTGPRYEQYQTLRAAKKYVSPQVYASTLKAIQRAQKRADVAAAAAEANRAAREAAKEALRQAKRKAAAQKAAETRAAKKAAALAKTQSVWHFRATAKVQQKMADGTFGAPFTKSHEGTVVATQANHRKAIDAEVAEWTENMDQESDLVVMGEPTIEIISQTPVLMAPVAATAVKMKQAGALFLDGEEQHEFDTGMGRCVFDWLIQRYGNVRGCKKVATLDGLTALFGEAALEDGVSCTDLVPFCDAVGCRMIALDETQQVIMTHTPTKINKNVPTLVFRVKNAHFYPIVSEANSISKYGNGFVTETAQVAEKDRVVAEEIVELVELENTEEPRSVQMVRICKEAGVEVFNRNSAKVPICMDDDGLQSFVLQGRKYYWKHDETVDAAIRICELNGEAYTGQHIPGMLAELMRTLKYDEKSSLNPHVSDILAQCKDRAHYGLVDGFESIPADAWACDIAKCYTACISEPMEPFMVFAVTDEWTAWDGDLKLGFYFVLTNDMTLLHGSNVYSAAILRRAQEEGIKFEVVKQLRPSKTLPRDYFARLLTAIREKCHGDASLAKFFVNILVGTLARTRLTRVFARMDTCADTVFADYNSDKSGVPFLMNAEGYYIYGRRVEKQISEHNLPMWIQILDASNIRLYDMIKASGGQLVGRKTDCAVLVGGSVVESGQIGGYRLCDVPSNMRQMRPVDQRSLLSDLCETPEWMYLPITSSSQVEEAWTALCNGSGLMINGRAGTGKTHIAKALAARFEGTVFKAAFTNKAALNIGGQTIHKMLRINSAGKFCLKSLKKRIGKSAALFIIDEISMIGANLWRLLCEVKKALPTAKFVLLGDNRQLGPVGETIDFFESSMVRFLAGGMRAELTEKQRYDQALWDFAEAIYAGLPLGFQRGAVMNGRHLCYLNATRRKINAMLNEKRGLFIAADPACEDSQDTYVYAGLPIIAVRNFSRGDDIYCVNAERFSVVSVGDRIRVMSERPDGEHFWDIEIEEFHQYFVMNFCSTVHKAQGETITGPVTIWDVERMDKRLLYTAVTRATRGADVYVA